MNIKFYLTVLVVCVLLPNLARAIDRDARAIVSAGGSYSKYEDDGSYGVGAGAEFAIAKDGKVGLSVGTGMTWYDDADEDAKSVSLGLSYYFTPQTVFYSSVSYSKHTFNEDFVHQNFPPDQPGVEFDHHYVYDVDVDVYGAGISLKHRFIPVKERISPYVSVGAGVSTASADVDGTMEDTSPQRGQVGSFKAQDYVSYDYDTSYGISGGAGVDFAITERVGLAIGASYGFHYGGSTFTLEGNKYESDDTSESWGVGASLKFYL